MTHKSEYMSPKTIPRTVGMLSDIGCVRAVDEDSVMVVEFTASINSEYHNYRLIVVADGMGGHTKGEVASKMALAAISTSVVPGLLEADAIPTELLREGVSRANADISEYVRTNQESYGMGTTAICALIRDGREVYLANIGDSRAYVTSHDEIRKVSKDHSYVQEQMDAGILTEEESRTHPQKNVITRAIGAGQPDAKPDIMRLTLDSDETLLLCCDGVIAHLTDEEIKKMVSESHGPQEACRSIVNLANQRGGSDNISLAILSHAVVTPTAAAASDTNITDNNDGDNT